MAVGYHRLNTSAARSKRGSVRELPPDRCVVIRAGALIWMPTYGNGVTLESFVSDCDKVRCEFDNGFTVVVSGSAVRVGIADYARKNSQ